MFKKILALFLVGTQVALAVPTSVIDGGFVRGQANMSRNFFANPFAEKNAAYLTGTNVTVARASGAGNQLNGISSYTLTSSTAGGTALSPAITLQDDVIGNCEASVLFKGSSGSSSNYTFYIDNGSGTVLNSVVLPAVTVWTKVSLNYPCASGYKIGFSHQLTGTDIIQAGNFYWGAATNIGSVSQAQLMGTAKVTGCAAAWSNTSTGSPASMGTQTGCVYTVTGQAQAPSTNVAGFKFASLPRGDYSIEYEGTAFNQGANNTMVLQFTDGTNTARELSNFYSATANMSTPGVRQSISYSSDQSNVTLQIYAYGTTGAVNSVWGTTANPGVFKLWYYPPQSQSAVRVDTSNWAVDATIGGSNFTISTAQQTTYTEMSDASMTLTNNTSVAGAIPALIACSATNASSGNTCASGNESNGIAFSIPAAGMIEVCTSGSVYTPTNATGNIGFAIVETGNTDQVVGQTSTSVSAWYNHVNSTSTYNVCGLFNVSASGKHTYRLMYKTDANSASPVVLADGTAGRIVAWRARPVTQNVPAPLLVGSVTSNSSGLERSERLTFGTTSATNCTSTPCGYLDQSGSWVSSVTRSGTGVYVVNFTAGMFSAKPTCTCGAISVGASASMICSPEIPTTSSVTLDLTDNAGTARDSYVQVHCMGAR